MKWKREIPGFLLDIVREDKGQGIGEYDYDKDRGIVSVNERRRGRLLIIFPFPYLPLLTRLLPRPYTTLQSFVIQLVLAKEGVKNMEEEIPSSLTTYSLGLTLAITINIHRPGRTSG